MKNYLYSKISENIKTILYALIIALIIRSFLFQPFFIPSSSMEPTLLVGDRLFVSKYSYGYSKHSLPFSPSIFKKRIFEKIPERGDVVVFKTPVDNRTDYIKRLIGLPGDKIQFIDGFLYLNKNKILRDKINFPEKIYCGNLQIEVNSYIESLPNGKSYTAVYNKEGTMLNSDEYVVPNGYYFFLGDNRDCSKDSRYLTSVGYVKAENLVGQAKMLFFSNDINKGYFFQFWKWKNSIRFNRFFDKIK